MKGEIPGWAII